MDELIISEEKYISSKRASEITGYAKDYIGQLCREGRVEARLVGRSWYVREAGIKDHRFGETESEIAKISPTDTNQKESVTQNVTYISELPPDLPKISSGNRDGTEVMGGNSTLDTTKDDIESAWQAWFSQNKIEEKSEVVPINKIEEPPRANFEPLEQVTDLKEEKEERVPLLRIADEIPLQQAEENEKKDEYEPQTIPIQYNPSPGRNEKANVFTKILLVMIGLIAIGISVLGTGLLTIEVKDGISAQLIQAISGTKIYIK